MEEFVKKRITSEMRDSIKAELQEMFPQVNFIAYWEEIVPIHIIAVDDVKFNHSREYRLALMNLEKRYASEYDILNDICFKYGTADSDNETEQAQVPLPENPPKKAEALVGTKS